MVILDAQQNDPTEMLEVFDSHGQPTGVHLDRASVHRQGAWHVAFHCWIVRPGPAGLEIVLQRRALAKDTFPNCWDASAAGHWRAGESTEDASREIAEELGVHIPFAALVNAGLERSARRHANGMVDREWHRVHLVNWTQPLTEYRPDPREVSGVATMLADDLLALVAGTREAAPTREAVEVLDDGSVQPMTGEVTRETLVPYSRARLERLIKAAREVVAQAV